MLFGGGFGFSVWKYSLNSATTNPRNIRANGPEATQGIKALSPAAMKSIVPRNPIARRGVLKDKCVSLSEFVALLVGSSELLDAKRTPEMNEMPSLLQNSSAECICRRRRYF